MESKGTNWVVVAGLISAAIVVSAIIVALAITSPGDDRSDFESMAATPTGQNSLDITAPEDTAPANPLADYQDEYLSEFDVKMYVSEDANVRDYPTPDGSRVVRSLSRGDEVEGRWVRGVTPNTRWLRVSGSSGASYVWEGALTRDRPMVAENYVDRYLSTNLVTLRVTGRANVRSFPGPSIGKVYFQMEEGDIVSGRWVRGINAEERYLRINTELGPAYIWEDNLR